MPAAVRMLHDSSKLIEARRTGQRCLKQSMEMKGKRDHIQEQMFDFDLTYSYLRRKTSKI